MSLGQAAIEYLTTYGWMILAAALVGGTFYSQLPEPCNFEPKSLGTQDLQMEQIGITQDEKLGIAFRSGTTEQVVIDQIELSGNESVYSNRSIRLYQSAKSVELGQAQRTENCEDFKLRIVYDRGPVPDIQKTVNLRLPIKLSQITFPFLKVGGGEINSLESNSTFIATGDDICMGQSCESPNLDENREREYVNRSGDEMKGSLQTNAVEWSCIGDSCDVEQGSLEGYVSEENNTVDGTLNLTEVKPDNNLCMGRTC